MADSSNDTIVRIKTEADTSGAEKVAKAQNAIANGATSASRQSTHAFERISNVLGGVGSSLGRIRRAMAGLAQFGLIASGITSLVNAFDELTGSARKAKEEAQKLAEANQKAADAKAAKDLAAAYDNLSKSIANSNRERERGIELENMKLGNARDLEDKKAELEKIREINKLDPNDPRYEDKKAAVERRFAEAAAGRSLARGREDNENEAKRTREEGFSKIADADEIRDLVKEDDRKIAEIRRRAKLAKQESTEDQDEDESYAGHVKNILTLNFDRWLQGRTEAGDEARKKKAQEAKELEELAERLQEGRDAKAKQAERLDEEGEHLLEKAKLIDERGMAIDETEFIAKERAMQPVVQRTAANIAIAENAGRHAMLAGRADDERARAQAAADAYRKEQGDVFAAQNRYDMLVANGGSRKERSAALAALQKEQEEANEAKFEMERVAAQVAATLNDINGQIRALSNAVRQAESRLSQNQTDAPEG